MGDCIEWQGSRFPKGYGQAPGTKYGTRYAHRQAAGDLHGAEAIKGRVVMHSCDNPPCVNPEHLEIGSYSRNNSDCYLRGRRGKLSPALATEIRERYSAGAVLQREMADEYGVSQRMISKVLNGESWAR